MAVCGRPRQLLVPRALAVSASGRGELLQVPVFSWRRLEHERQSPLHE